MFNRIKYLLASFSILVMLLTPAVVSAAANDQIFGACNDNTASSSVCQSKNNTENPVTHFIKVAANIIALATGIGAVIMIIVGGLTMVTSAGNAERAATARRRIIYSVVGLVVVALAWTATRFITDRVIQ